MNVFSHMFLITGLASNFIICFVVVKMEGRKTLSKLFIFHLALTDIVSRLTSIYGRIIETIACGAPSPLNCNVIVFWQYVCGAVLFSLSAGIALDRSKNIIKPLESFKNRYCHREKTVALIWRCAIVISATFIYTAKSVRFTRKFNLREGNSIRGIPRNTDKFFTILTFTSPRKHCDAGPPSSVKRQISLMVLRFLGRFFIPLCIMTACNIYLVYFPFQQSQAPVANSVVVRSKLKTLYMLLLLVLSFPVSWGSITILDLLASFKFLDSDTKQWLRPAAEVFYQSSSILNPFIYALWKCNL